MRWGGGKGGVGSAYELLAPTAAPGALRTRRHQRGAGTRAAPDVTAAAAHPPSPPRHDRRPAASGAPPHQRLRLRATVRAGHGPAAATGSCPRRLHHRPRVRPVLPAPRSSRPRRPTPVHPGPDTGAHGPVGQAPGQDGSVGDAGQDRGDRRHPGRGRLPDRRPAAVAERRTHPAAAVPSFHRRPAVHIGAGTPPNHRPTPTRRPPGSWSTPARTGPTRSSCWPTTTTTSTPAGSVHQPDQRAGVLVHRLHHLDPGHRCAADPAQPGPPPDSPGPPTSTGSATTYVLYFTASSIQPRRRVHRRRRRHRPPSALRSTAATPFICQSDLGGSIDPRVFTDSYGTNWMLWKSDQNPTGSNRPHHAVVPASHPGRSRPGRQALRSHESRRALAGHHRGGARHGRGRRRLLAVLLGQLVQPAALRHRGGPVPRAAGALRRHPPTSRCWPPTPRDGPGEESVLPNTGGAWLLYTPVMSQPVRLRPGRCTSPGSASMPAGPIWPPGAPPAPSPAALTGQATGVSPVVARSSADTALPSAWPRVAFITRPVKKPGQLLPVAVVPVAVAVPLVGMGRHHLGHRGDQRVLGHGLEALGRGDGGRVTPAGGQQLGQHRLGLGGGQGAAPSMVKRAT